MQWALVGMQLAHARQPEASADENGGVHRKTNAATNALSDDTQRVHPERGEGRDGVFVVVLVTSHD